MAYFYVYEHWRTDREECFYVGKGSGRRAYAMAARNRHHLAIQAKVFREGFAVEVKIVAAGLNEEAAYVLEADRVAFWRSAGVDLANVTAGGGGIPGFVQTAEARARISKKLKGGKRRKAAPISEETRAKLRASGKARFTDKMRETLRAANTGNKYTLGRYDKEHIEKLRVLNTGCKRSVRRVHSQETKAKMAAAHLGRKMLPADVEKAAAVHRKRVLCVSDGLLFESATAAALYYGQKDHGNVAAACRGARPHAVGKRVFKYVGAD